MATVELIKELKLRENELEAKLEDINSELNAIRILIGVYHASPEGDTDIVRTKYPILEGNANIVRTKYPNKFTPAGDIEPKGSENWQDYAYAILSSFEEAKASVVAECAIKANPKIASGTIRNAISSKLSKLYLAEKIDAVPGANKKDGYTYKIKKSQ
jgi:hypothetical protein